MSENQAIEEFYTENRTFPPRKPSLQTLYSQTHKSITKRLKTMNRFGLNKQENY